MKTGAPGTTLEYEMVGARVSRCGAHARECARARAYTVYVREDPLVVSVMATDE